MSKYLTDAQMSVALNILGAVETGGQIYGNRRYDDFTSPYASSPVEYSCTAGAFQEYGENLRQLLIRIKKEYPATFKKYDTGNIAADIQRSWSDSTPYKVYAGTAKAKAIVAIISSTDGKKVQDARAADLIDSYLAHITGLGVTNVRAALFCAECEHLGGAKPIERIIKRVSNKNSITALYKSLMLDQNDTSNSYQIGDKIYQTRHDKCKGWIEQYIRTNEVIGKKEDATMATVQQVIDDAVDFAVRMANDNTHGYSQAIRSLYNTTNPTSFDCSSLVCTAFYHAFKKHGITPTPKDLGCTYTGNMLNLLKCGFEIVATNQTAHSQMCKGDIELHTVYHTALAIDGDNIVHARSSEGTSNTRDDSGNEIRTQPWYLYSRGWTHRLRFTGKGLNLSGSTSTDTPTTGGKNYMFEMNAVKKGSAGNHVLLVQEILKARGYKGKDGKLLELDRECGDNTVHAIRRYQADREAVTPGICGGVDGVAGAKTLQDMIAL